MYRCDLISIRISRLCIKALRILRLKYWKTACIFMQLADLSTWLVLHGNQIIEDYLGVSTHCFRTCIWRMSLNASCWTCICWKVQSISLSTKRRGWLDRGVRMFNRQVNPRIHVGEMCCSNVCAYSNIAIELQQIQILRQTVWSYRQVYSTRIYPTDSHQERHQ